MPGQSYFVPAPNAVSVVELAAAPGLLVAAKIIAQAIPNYVPVVHGGARKTYKTSISGGILEGGSPQARVHISSPFWHFLEYGTRYSIPYRPIQTAIGALGLRYVPS